MYKCCLHENSLLQKALKEERELLVFKLPFVFRIFAIPTLQNSFFEHPYQVDFTYSSSRFEDVGFFSGRNLVIFALYFCSFIIV